MKKQTFSALLFLSTFPIVAVIAEERPYVLLVSFDGFRADYLDWCDTPNFDKIAEEGVKAASLQPCFPSKTFPNHYSIATGMYIENHGMIGNFFYDDKLNKSFSLRDRESVQNPQFYGGEPIWVTAEKQGVRTAAFYWPGTEARISGIQPSIWKLYDQDVPFDARIDSVAAWFSLPENRRPHLITLYFHEPDWTGHSFGSASRKTKHKVIEMDAVLDHLMRKMKQLPVYNTLNIIIVSDHGMTSVTTRKIIPLQKYVNLEKVNVEGDGSLSMLYGEDQHALEEAYMRLQKAKHITVYRKNDIPERLHYKNHYRIKDVLIIADDGWTIQKKKQGLLQGFFTTGEHGYDNTLQSMQAIFLADGPAFKDGYSRTTVENIHIYPLIAEILGLEPCEKIDGKLEEISDVLKAVQF